VRPPLVVRAPATIDLFGRELGALPESEGVIELPLRPREIATVRLA